MACCPVLDSIHVPRVSGGNAQLATQDSSEQGEGGGHSPELGGIAGLLGQAECTPEVSMPFGASC